MAGSSAFIRTVGLGRLFDALTSMIEAAEREGDWWVGTVVRYSSFIEFGTSKMRARPYFQPSILRVARRLDFAKARTIGDRKRGRSMWAVMVDPDAETDSDSPLAERLALELEREVKETIKEKGLIDTGHLRASIVAAPTLPRMKRESFNSMSSTATSRRTGETVARSEIVDRGA